MSRAGTKLKSYRLPEVEKRPLSNKFSHTLKAGLAAAGPPLGPILGKYGINIAAFCKDFNQKTSHYIKGVPLPCNVTVNPDRSYDIVIKKPPVTYYLQQAAGISSFERYNGVSGMLTLKHIYEIAKIKHEDPHSFLQLDSLQEVCKKFLGIAYLSGIKIVEHIDPEEYEKFLKEKKEYLEKLAAELAAEQEAKLLRG